MINTADFAFIDALSNVMGFVDWIGFLNEPLIGIGIILQFVASFIANLNYEDIENENYKVTIPITMIVITGLLLLIMGIVGLISSNFDNISDLNTALVKVEQKYPGVYDQARADHVRNLYLNCYHSSENNACPVHQFIKGYMVENWNTKTN